MIIKTTVTRNNDGVEQRIFIEQYRATYPYPHVVTKVIAKPTTKGMQSDKYYSVRRQLGDDWESDLTDCWFMPGTLTPRQQIAIQRTLDNLG
jgi:hypothetical protein